MADDYALLTYALNISWADGTSQTHAEELAIAGQHLLPTLSESFQRLTPGDWDLISHDVLRVDDGLVLSILARRHVAAR